MSTNGRGAVGAMRAWFERNPGEFLTYDDMVKLFGFKNKSTAAQATYVLKHEGIIKSGFFVYTDPERPRT